MNKSQCHQEEVDTNQSCGLHSHSEELISPWSLLGVTDTEIDDALNGEDDHSLELHDDDDDDKSLRGGDIFFPDHIKSKDVALPEKPYHSMGRFDAFRRRSSLVMTRRRSSMMTKRKSISFASDIDYEPCPKTRFRLKEEAEEEDNALLLPFHFTQDAESSLHHPHEKSNLVLPDMVELQMQYQKSLQRFSNSMHRSDQTRSIVQHQCRQFIQNHPTLLMQSSTPATMPEEESSVKDWNDDDDDDVSVVPPRPANTTTAPPPLQLFSPHRQVERDHTRQMIYRMLCQNPGADWCLAP